MDYKIINLSAKIDKEIDIEKIKRLDNVLERDNFLILRIIGTRATYLIFKKSKTMIITGVKSEDKLKKAIKIFESITKE